jgi:hypothetical protein
MNGQVTVKEAKEKLDSMSEFNHDFLTPLFYNSFTLLYQNLKMVLN